MALYTPEQLAYLQTLRRGSQKIGEGFSVDEKTGVFTFDPPLGVGEKLDFEDLRQGEHKREIVVHIETEQATWHWGRHTAEPKGISRGMPFCEYLWVIPEDMR